MIFWGYRAGSEWYGPEDGTWHWQRSALGGWTAGVACSLVYCPLQAIKCTSQVQRMAPLPAARRLWDFGGLRKGEGPTRRPMPPWPMLVEPLACIHVNMCAVGTMGAMHPNGVVRWGTVVPPNGLRFHRLRIQQYNH